MIKVENGTVEIKDVNFGQMMAEYTEATRSVRRVLIDEIELTKEEGGHFSKD